LNSAPLALKHRFGAHSPGAGDKNSYFRAFLICSGVVCVLLLDGHNCADWNFGEEFARSIFRQSDAAV